MKLEVIHIAELNTLLRDKRYLQLPVLPVTPERAHSQAVNPLADSNDPALIIAWNEQDEMLGFIGILKGKKLDDGLPVYFNTGWWIDPIHGRPAAMPLFYKMLELTQGRLIFFELTIQTEKIVKALNVFFLAEPLKGLYGWFRSGLKYRMAGPERSRTLLFAIGEAMDFMLNLPLQIRIHQWLKSNRAKGSVLLETADPDIPEVKSFLEQYSRTHFLTRNPREISWVIQNPWLTDNPSVSSSRYYFSWKVFSFSTHPFLLLKDGQMVGFILLSLRDGILKVPIFYVLPGAKREAAMEILAWSLRSKAHGWILWQRELLDAMHESRFPLIKKSLRTKQVAWSEKLGKLIPPNWIPQDGDGDGIFT